MKMAHEVQESGETQDFMDDVEYLLDNLKDSQPYSIRALRFVLCTTDGTKLRKYFVTTDFICLWPVTMQNSKVIFFFIFILERGGWVGCCCFLEGGGYEGDYIKICESV